MAKNRYHGVYYSTRALRDGGYGILVSAWRAGVWIETDMNTTPYNTRGIAFGQATRVAKQMGEREGLRIKCVLGGSMHRTVTAIAIAA